MKKSPLISVLMPVYNGQQYLKEAIESILKQSYTNFEFIIINDGSTDSSASIIRLFHDPRIRYVENKKNIGIAESLNKGLKLAKGEYIARMDCDDLSHPLRLEKQAAFLMTHTDYGVVASIYALLNAERIVDQIGGVKLLEDKQLKMALFTSNIFCHGETMFRRDLCLQHKIFYDNNDSPCEDYGFWVKLSCITKFKTLPDVLYYYMVNPNSVSGLRWQEVLKKVSVISKRVQKTMPLPKVDIGMLLQFYNNGVRYIDGIVYEDKKCLKSNQKVLYQIFLIKTAFVYLKKLQLIGFGMVLIGILISPANCLKLFFKQFSRSPNQRVIKI